jgi:hypothetical protein
MGPLESLARITGAGPMQLPKGGMGHHHEAMDHRDPEQVSVSSPEAVLYDGSSAIVRANSALLYSAGRSGFYEDPRNCYYS